MGLQIFGKVGATTSPDLSGAAPASKKLQGQVFLPAKHTFGRTTKKFGPKSKILPEFAK